MPIFRDKKNGVVGWEGERDEPVICRCPHSLSLLPLPDAFDWIEKKRTLRTRGAKITHHLCSAQQVVSYPERQDHQGQNVTPTLKVAKRRPRRLPPTGLLRLNLGGLGCLASLLGHGLDSLDRLAAFLRRCLGLLRLLLIPAEDAAELLHRGFLRVDVTLAGITA